ncbi:MAG: Crp/Fnr family transcriptional regulator [Pseudomonadota bacterium]
MSAMPVASPAPDPAANDAVHARLWRQIEPFALPHDLRAVVPGDRLARAKQPIGHLIVPVSAVVVVARQNSRDRVPLTVGLVGSEGVLGWPVLMDRPIWSHDAIALVAGQVATVAADVVLAACRAEPRLQSLLLRVAHNYGLQLAQSVVANLGHSVERRLARWLLMLHDRTTGDSLALTHEQIATLLNVRRATVTDALHVIEGDRLIKATRGRILVRDRAGLERVAAMSYGFHESDYRETIGPFGKGLPTEQP